MLSMVSRQCVYAVSSVHRRYRLFGALLEGTVLSMVSSVYRQYRQCVYVGYRALIKGTVLSIVSIDTV